MRRIVSIESLESRALLSADPTFAPDSPFYTGNTPWEVATGDFNRDGNLDFITADRGSNTVTIRRGRGDGTFRPARTISFGALVVDVVVADFNNNGRLDFAVALANLNRIVSFKGDGAGNFTRVGAVGAGNLTHEQFRDDPRLVSGDFDGDGKVDLAISNPGDDSISVVRGKGTGAFFFRVNSQIPREPGFDDRPFTTGAMAAADLDGDGKSDLIVAGWVGTTNILRGIGGGRFALQQQFNRFSPDYYVIAPHDIAIADFNNDQVLDFAISDGATDGGRLFHGTGGANFSNQGTFGVSTHTPGIERGPRGMVAADFNGDGFVDLATANTSSGTRTVIVNDGTGDFPNSGIFETPFFTDEDEGPFPPTSKPIALAVGDFNNDQRPDLILANYNANNVTLLLNTTVPI
jgi:hypothetical protein